MKIPPMNYIKVPPMDVKPFDPTKNTFKCEMAAVVDKARDEAVIAAIRAYAIEKGYEGIFVIDEDFIKSAIAHEYYIRARTMADLICNNDDYENDGKVGKWIDATENLPDPDVIVLAAVTGTPKENVKLYSAYFLASYSSEEGWILEGFEDWKTNIIVTHWCKVPAPPKIKT